MREGGDEMKYNTIPLIHSPEIFMQVVLIYLKSIEALKLQPL